MTLRDQLAQQALALSPEDRLFVVDLLEQSLNHDEFADPHVATAWAEEIDRRIAAYERDEIHAADAEVSATRVRQQLAEHRARKAAP